MFPFLGYEAGFARDCGRGRRRGPFRCQREARKAAFKLFAQRSWPEKSAADSNDGGESSNGRTVVDVDYLRICMRLPFTRFSVGSVLPGDNLWKVLAGDDTFGSRTLVAVGHDGHID